MLKRLRQKNEFKDSLDTTEMSLEPECTRENLPQKKRGGGENKIKCLGENMSESFTVPV